MAAAVAALSELSLTDDSATQQQQRAGAAAAAASDVLCPAILEATFCWLQDDLDLARCSSVCRTWQSVLRSDAIWRAVYLQQLPPPAAFERVSSFRQQFARLRGLSSLQDPGPTALKGSAVCFNAASGNLVSYNPRQRMLSIQLPGGAIRSEVLDTEGAGSACKPLLASSGSTLVVLAAFDGVLQLWDASCCQHVGLLGRHPSFVLSLSASGDLAASSCSSELRLWQLSSRQCLFTVPIGFPMALSHVHHEPLPHIAVCHEQQLLALANATTPAPCSVVKVYSTVPAATPSAAAAGSAAAAAGSVAVGSSDAPGAAGALLLRELPVNAADGLLLQQGLLLVASCFHATSWSHNTPYRSERPYTVTVQIWDTQHWQLTRLVSPRLWTDYPITAMHGTPIIALTQGLLLCATLKSSCDKGSPPSCSIQAWQLARQLLLRPGSGGAAAAGGNLRLLAVNGAGSSSSISSSRRQPEPFGEGAVALGRAALATAGGAGGVGVSASNTVMLAISDSERSHWSQLLHDTGGRLHGLVVTPTQLVLATEGGNVLSSPLLEVSAQEQEQQLQEQQGGAAGQMDRGAAAEQRDGGVARFLHVGM